MQSSEKRRRSCDLSQAILSWCRQWRNSWPACHEWMRCRSALEQKHYMVALFLGPDARASHFVPLGSCVCLDQACGSAVYRFRLTRQNDARHLLTRSQKNEWQEPPETTSCITWTVCWLDLDWILFESWLAGYWWDLDWILIGSWLVLDWILIGSCLDLAWILIGSWLDLDWILVGS